MSQYESVLSILEPKITPPITVSAIKSKTREEMKACFIDVTRNMMQGKYDSLGNEREVIELRKQIYEWEKLLYNEPNGTKYHRKFVRNYLIELESGFEEDIRSRTGARGMMQLTGNVLDDMEKRSHRFRAQMRKIGISTKVHACFPLHIRATIENVIKNPTKPVDIRPLIEYLRIGEGRKLLMSNGYVNAYIGSMYFSILSETVNIESVPNELQYYRNLKGKIHYPALNKLIREKLLSIDPNPGKIVKIPEITPETYNIFLNTLEQNPDLTRSIFAARRYNGSNVTKGYERYGSGLREKDVYFIVLGYTTTLSMLTDQNYRSHYCREVKTIS